MTNQSKETPLKSIHEKLGATFTDFAGWDMPVRYTSDLAEHKAVRSSAGLFDLSHMGEVFFEGPEAAKALDYALAGNISVMPLGRAKYSLLLNEEGGIIDDLITYRVGEQRYMVVPNAGNTDVDVEALFARAEKFDCTVTNASGDIALVAVQGPESARIVTELLETADTGLGAADVEGLGYYRAIVGTFDGAELIVARTGYTGEDGFELYVPNAQAESLWNRLTEIGGEALVPCGLAARDSLRLEAGMPLYGNELSLDIVPAQANLGPVVSFKKESDFVGRAALEGKDFSDRPVLVGLVAEGRRAARSGSAIRTTDGTELGTVTSGALSPTLGHPIAMGFIDPAHAAVGTNLIIDVRGKDLPATVVELPFYSRG